MPLSAKVCCLYSFEVIKIELFDESNSSILTANDPNSLGGLTINTANLLQNVERFYKLDKKSYLCTENKAELNLLIVIV